MTHAFHARLLDGVVQSIGIVGGADVVEVRKLRAGNAQVQRRHAGRQQELVEGNFLAALQRDDAAGSVELRRADAGAQAHAVVGVPARRQGEQPGAVAAVRLAKVFLAQRRTVVRSDALGADDHHLAARVELADRLRRRAAGESAADE